MRSPGIRSSCLKVAAVLCAVLLVSGSAAASEGAPFMWPCRSGMSRQADAHFVVWACQGGSGARRAESAALGVAAALYGQMTALMGRPLPDSGGIAGGGDTRIDVYLLGGGQSLTRQGRTSGLGGGDLAAAMFDNRHGTASSAYLLLDRSRARIAQFRSDVAHELFHLLADRYSTGWCDGGQYWFTEASAVWAQSIFAAGSAGTEVYSRFTSDFQPYPGLSLLATGHDHAYASFIWPYFMQQEKGAASIARAWTAMAGLSSCAAMTAAVSAQLPFTRHFGDFAVRNLGARLPARTSAAPPVPAGLGPRYQQLHPDFPQHPLAISPHPPAPPAPRTRTVKISISPLAARYDHYQVSCPAEEADVSFSSISNRSRLDINAIITDNRHTASTRPYHRIRVTGSQLPICSRAAGSVSADIYLVLANHDDQPGQTVTGTYTMTQTARPSGSPARSSSPGERYMSTENPIRGCKQQIYGPAGSTSHPPGPVERAPQARPSSS